jgi:hypothetical protein
MVISDLKVGTIVHFFDEESYQPKPKYSVIVGLSGDSYNLATVFINTNIKSEHLNSPELAKLHYKISCKRYSNFLKDDSFVDCSDLKHRQKTSFLEALNSPSGKIVGNLATDDLENVLNMILASDTISPYYLKLYCISK